MASQAPPASRRRSQREDIPASSSSCSRPAPEPESMEDAEYFMLNRSQISNLPDEQHALPPQSQDSTLQTPAPAPAPIVPREDVRECWICREEDTDDGPGGSEWRSPCPCSMQAHEDCLLQWVTAQSQRPAQELRDITSPIACPVCKYRYQINAPKDYLVMATDAVKLVAESMVVPTVASMAVGTIWSGAMIYGINTLHVVFGPVDASGILAPGQNGFPMYGPPPKKALVQVLGLIKMMDPFFPDPGRDKNWKLFFGLPLIAPALILSRTTIADPIFTILPTLYFASNFTQQRINNRPFLDWPPGPALTFAILPYVRQAYNQLYKAAFSKLEAKWEMAVHRTPREGETPEGIQAADAAQQGDGLLDIQVEVIEEIVEGNEDGLDGQAGQAGAQGQQNEGEAQNPDQQGVQAPGQGRQNHNNWNVQRNIRLSDVGATVMGALFFPAISSLMGDLLKLSLPGKYVADVPFWRSSYGILQKKWGRTVVGGCLFVVLKDALLLYYKWKKARDMGKRSIRNYVKP